MKLPELFSRAYRTTRPAPKKDTNQKPKEGRSLKRSTPITVVASGIIPNITAPWDDEPLVRATVVKMGNPKTTPKAMTKNFLCRQNQNLEKL